MDRDIYFVAAYSLGSLQISFFPVQVQVQSSTVLSMHKVNAYPVMCGSVSEEKRASGALSRSMSHVVYCPLCLGWRNTAMSRLQGPWPPHSQGLSTQGPPKAERLTQRN